MTLTIDLRDVPVAAAIDTLRKQTRAQIVYSRTTLAADRLVTVRGENITLATALKLVLENTGTEARMTRNANIVLLPVSATRRAENGTILAKIVSAKTKQPVPSATITLGDAPKGVVTGADGLARLTVAPGEYVVHVRAVGFGKQSKTVVVTEGETVTVELLLEASASVLDQVVVTGTVVATERKAIPTPITVITAKELEERNITKIEQLFRGEIPGVFAQELGSAMYSPSTPGAAVTSHVYTRGSSALGNSGGGAGVGSTPMKTFVDGVELLDASYIGTIDPKNIERIEIVTGPQAATIYGSGALGGVMQIFTKKGLGKKVPEVTLSLRYGMLENNLSTGLTPTHNDNVNLAGGNGADLTYSVGVSYNYSGQWQPNLYYRTYGAQVGATHTRGRVTATLSIGANMGENGTFTGSARDRQLDQQGIWNNRNYYALEQRKVSRSSSQTVSLNLSYNPFSWWQNQLTVGGSQNSFTMTPEAPIFRYPSDTLYSEQSNAGQRTTFAYTATMVPAQRGPVTATLTMGTNGSSGGMQNLSGTKARPENSSYISTNGRTTLDDKSWGGFGTLRLGVFNALYFTAGMRWEHNANYGSSRRFSITPSNGLAYTFEMGDVTLKLLGSYGKATRAPTPEQRLGRISVTPYYDPPQYESLFPNPYLTPEFSKGPQGGLEFYYGNRGSFTVTHYQQKVTDLIQQVKVDSLEVFYIEDPQYLFVGQYMNMNTATIRQQGWEGTANLNLGPLSLRGTYTYSHTKVLSFGAGQYFYYPPFIALPSNTANLTIGYARGGTSISLVNNIVGQQLSRVGDSPYNEVLQYYNSIRIKMYHSRVTSSGMDVIAVPGYIKSDLNMSHRLNPWASLTVNVANIGNSYGQEQVFNAFYHPTLGRISTFGMSLRFPRTR